jgi:hypothetical protein
MHLGVLQRSSKGHITSWHRHIFPWHHITQESHVCCDSNSARPLDLLSNIAGVVMNVDIANNEVTKVIVTRLIPIVNIIKVSMILLMAAFSFSFGFNSDPHMYSLKIDLYYASCHSHTLFQGIAPSANRDCIICSVLS